MMKCEICKNITLNYFQDKRGNGFYICSTCGFIQRDPTQFLTPEKEKERYLLHQNNDSDTGYVAYLMDFLQTFVIPNSRKGGSVLDFGSGPNPVFLKLLKNYGFKAVGFDPFFNNNPHYAADTYDVIILIEVLEHIARPVEVLTKLIQILKPDGCLIVRTELIPEQDPDLQKFLSWWYKEDKTHVSFYSESSIQALAEELLLKNVNISERKKILFKRA